MPYGLHRYGHGRVVLSLRGLIIILALWASGFSASAQITPGSQAAELENCVEPTEYMRKNHMDLLFHQRDVTVHEGIRSKQHSLVNCVDCHASADADGSFASVNAPGQFCEGCHSATAVTIDCFECHASRPDREATIPKYWSPLIAGNMSASDCPSLN